MRFCGFSEYTKNEDDFFRKRKLGMPPKSLLNPGLVRHLPKNASEPPNLLLLTGKKRGVAETKVHS